LERIGETQRHDAPKSGELKREAAFRWSGDEAQRGGSRRSKLTII
jgi:hypothetical protein